MGGLFRIVFPQPKISAPPPPPVVPLEDDPAVARERERARRAALRARARRTLNPTGALGDSGLARVAQRTLIGSRRLGG